jgi:hypothetical protein
MRDREVLEGPLRLARLKQCSQRASGNVVGDVLPLEYAHNDRVSVGGERTSGRRLDVHAGTLPATDP